MITKKTTLIIWMVLLVIFILNQVLERISQIHIPILYSYLDDLIAVPLTLLTYQLLVQNLKNNAHSQLPASVVVTCIIGFSFHFELLMPIISTKYTADLVDIAMYISGGLFYAAISNWQRIKILSQ